MPQRSYEDLKAQLRELSARGVIDPWPSQEQRADWAYGNTAVENNEVTREMADRAVQEKPSPR